MKMIPYKGDKPYIFISYAHKDGEKVLPILRRMQEDGYRIWMDEGIDPATEWDDFIADKLYDCSYFIAFLSDNYLASSNCKDELNYARDLEKQRLLVYLEDLVLPRGMAMRLNRLQSIFKHRYAQEADFYEKLYQAEGLAQFLDEKPKERAGKPRAKKEKPKFEPNFSLMADFINSIEELPEEEKDEVLETALKLCETMHMLDLACDPVSAARGDSVTRYEFRPRETTKVANFRKYEADFALALSVTGVRIQVPIPGKALVGFEVPNRQKKIAPLTALMKEEAYLNGGKTVFCLGRDLDGKPVLPDLKKLPHLIVGGQTGSGKTTVLYAMLLSLLAKNTPEELRLVLIDPKKVEFLLFEKLPHLYHPIVTEVKAALDVLNALHDEMERRFSLLSRESCRSVDDYNRLVGDRESLPHILVVVDELADLMLFNRSKTEGILARLLQKSRAAGIHIVLSSQRPTVDVLTGMVKANIPSRLALKTVNAMDSLVILDEMGAEKLAAYGDALFAPVTGMGNQRVQCAYVTYEEAKSMIASWEGTPLFDESFLSYIKKQTESSEEGNQKVESRPIKQEDSLSVSKADLEMALDAAVTCSNVSTSLLQRKLTWGYGRAARVIDYLCAKEFIERDKSGRAYRVKITREDIPIILAQYDET